MGAIEKARAAWALAREVARAPRLTIDLMHARAAEENDPFFARITEKFYRHATSRHPRFPLARRLEYGYAVGALPAGGMEGYLARIEASARRNVKKAIRLGYRFEAIDYNARLDDVTAILRSTTTRQGKPMPERLIKERARPHANPPSRSHFHDYPYFGVSKDDRLVAYAGCMVAGELCAIESIYGHAEFLSDAVVPLMIVSITGYLAERHPAARYYSYDTYFGAGETLRRFKRKFLFAPHRVTWRLGDRG